MTPHRQAVGLHFSSTDGPAPGSQPGKGDALDPAFLARPVLVIEDEAVIAWTLEGLLEDMGFHQIAIAASAADALDKAREVTPGLIVSDINLGAGQVDGIAAAAALQALAPAPVVFITAYAGPEERERIARDVADAAVLRKPVRGVELRQALVAIARRGGMPVV